MLTENRAIRILLVGEEALVRTALQKLLESWGGFEVIGESATKDETLELTRRLDPDVILLSLTGSEAADLEIVQDLARGSQRAQLLALMGECAPAVRVQVVRIGARGVVQRKKGAGELRKAIQKVYEGEIWLDRLCLATLITHSAKDDERDGNGREQPGLAHLTNREREVVALVIKGLRNRDVGEQLFISETTVRHHLTTIFGKLNLSSRSELIAYVHRQRFSGSDGSARAPGRLRVRSTSRSG